MVDFLNLSIENTEYAQDLCLERIVEEISRTFLNPTQQSVSFAGFANEFIVFFFRKAVFMTVSVFSCSREKIHRVLM